MPTRIRLTEAQLKVIIERVIEDGGLKESAEGQDKLEETAENVLEKRAMTDPEVYGKPINSA